MIFIEQYPDFMSSLTPEETQNLYKSLLQRMNYAVDYTPDVEVFYRQLHTQLDEFIQGVKWKSSSKQGFIS